VRLIFGLLGASQTAVIQFQKKEMEKKQRERENKKVEDHQKSEKKGGEREKEEKKKGNVSDRLSLEDKHAPSPNLYFFSSSFSFSYHFFRHPPFSYHSPSLLPPPFSNSLSCLGPPPSPPFLLGMWMFTGTTLEVLPYPREPPWRKKRTKRKEKEKRKKKVRGRKRREINRRAISITLYPIGRRKRRRGRWRKEVERERRGSHPAAPLPLLHQ